MILYAAADLLWATRIKATSDSLGISARPVRSIDMLRARIADSDVRGLIVDLETGPTGIDLIREARGTAPEGAPAPFPIVAFGPHVAVEMLSAAREAGAGRVLARGAFADRIAQIITELEASAERPRADGTG